MKTSGAIKSIPKKHSLVITGTPLENNLRELYSIMQFVDPRLLSPQWEFSMNHCTFDKSKKNKITGCFNLQALKEKLSAVVIRREKRAVLDQLPPVREHNIPIWLSEEQKEIHAGYARIVMMILSKKYLTLTDHQRLFQLFTKMRMVCDSTYLIDRETNISPKLKELSSEDSVDFSRKNKATFFSQLKDMMEGLDEDIFGKDDTPEEEGKPEEKSVYAEFAESETQAEEKTGKIEPAPEDEPVREQTEVLEETLNKGLDFLSGIMQMATGKTLETGEKSITVDKETGEVTMKFKLPGF